RRGRSRTRGGGEAPPEGHLRGPARSGRARWRRSHQSPAAREERLGLRPGLRVRARSGPSRADAHDHGAIPARAALHRARRRHRPHPRPRHAHGARAGPGLDARGRPPARELRRRHHRGAARRARGGARGRGARHGDAPDRLRCARSGRVRAARGGAGTRCAGVLRGALGARGGRGGGRGGGPPPRLRVAPPLPAACLREPARRPHRAASRASALETAAMVERIIEFSARNRVLVLLLTGAALLAAVWCVRHVPLDAIPDLSDTQVIVFSRWDRSPDVIEDQVTYPIVTALLGAPKVKAIRAFSDFGYSYVYVIFQDGTDLYWARSRVLEYLSKIQARLPSGVQTELGPDATSVGWVFQYALVDKSGQHDLASLRSLQDWYLRYHLQSVPGVAEVAAVGGFVKQYQVTVDPNRLLAYGVPLTDVIDAVRKGNAETGGRLLEFSGAEYMVRGRGY